MDALDAKIVDNFPGKIVRKDLTAYMKRGANVPPSSWNTFWGCIVPPTMKRPYR